jgi:chromosome segregation ATPase
MKGTMMGLFSSNPDPVSLVQPLLTQQQEQFRELKTSVEQQVKDVGKQITGPYDTDSLHARLNKVETQITRISEHLSQINASLLDLQHQIQGASVALDATSPYAVTGKRKSLRGMEEAFLRKCWQFLYEFEEDYLKYLEAHEAKQQETRRVIAEEEKHIAGKKSEFLPPLTPPEP